MAKGHRFREDLLQAITPDAHGVAVLLLTAIALFLFTRDNIPLQTSSLAVLIILVSGFHLFPYTADGSVLRAVELFRPEFQVSEGSPIRWLRRTSSSQRLTSRTVCHR